MAIHVAAVVVGVHGVKITTVLNENREGNRDLGSTYVRNICFFCGEFKASSHSKRNARLSMAVQLELQSQRKPGRTHNLCYRWDMVRNALSSLPVR